MPAGLPHFLGLGIKKGGTTTLHQLLSQHPQVYLSASKELHYFDLIMQQEGLVPQPFPGSNDNAEVWRHHPFYLIHPDVRSGFSNFFPMHE